MIGPLTNHLWQSTVFAIAAGLMTLAFRKNRAKVRYGLWLSASLKFLAPFSLLIAAGSQMHWSPGSQAIAARAAAPSVSWTVEQFSEPFGPAVPDRPPAPARDWRPAALFAVWLAGFASVAVWRWRAWQRVRAAVRASRPVEVPAAVETRMAPGLLEPGVIGFWHPVLLLPDGILERLTPSQLEAVLAHELCHVRRRDNLFAAVHMVVEAAFWFHPLVWWIGARMVEERERACDEDVLKLGSEPRVYADAILSVCKLYLESPLACMPGVSGADIGRRIEAIMSNRMAQGLNDAKKFLLAGAGVVALAAPIAMGVLIGIGHAPAVHAQPPAQPAQAAPAPAPAQQRQAPAAPPKAAPVVSTAKFDVATVKPCEPGDGAGMSGRGKGRGTNTDPGRLRVNCMTVAELIDIYLQDGNEPRLLNQLTGPMNQARIQGGPAWMRTDQYSIEAETSDPVANGPTRGRTPATMLMTGTMLRTLLEDRFQLKTHRETEEVPMYALTVAKGGLKLKPTPPDGCRPHDPNTGTFVNEMFPPGQTPMCTQWTHFDGPNWAIDGAGQELRILANALSTVMNRHVLDRTGIAGPFTYHLRFARDDSAPGEPLLRQRPFPESDLPPGPSIFAAVEEIGLKLVKDKGPQEHLVVDSVARPSAN